MGPSPPSVSRGGNLEKFEFRYKIRRLGGTEGGRSLKGQRMKPGNDTSMGGAEAWFPREAGGVVSRLCDPEEPIVGRDWEEFTRIYWKPVYRFFRVSWAKGNEDAKDLTQTFFLWLMEGEVLRKFDSSLGSFRSFLKTLLRRFASHQEEARTRFKRGGHRKILSLEELRHADVAEPRDPVSENPEEEFDREWVGIVLEKALDRVRHRFQSSGREIQFRVFEAVDLESGPDVPDYGELTKRFALGPNDVRNHLYLVREAVRREVRAAVADLTVSGREEEEEWKALLRS